MILNLQPYYQDNHVTLYHAQCQHILPFLPPHDLLLTDPPYGIKACDRKRALSRVNPAKPKVKSKDYGEQTWDNQPVPDWLITLCRSLCKKQIIFGGNYYHLPPCIGPLIWDKKNGATDFADGEYAWNNLGTALRIKPHLWNGMIRKDKEPRFHPTQKPLQVIQWCIERAKHPATILDPFAGSGTTGVAAKLANLKATLIEQSETDCQTIVDRLKAIHPPSPQSA